MRSTVIGLAVVVLLGLSTWARAQEHAAPHATPATTLHETPHDATAARQPVPPDASPMPGSVIILILGTFLAATIVGPVVRYHEPEAPPEPSDHDDHGNGAHDHAHGHGHGH